MGRLNDKTAFVTGAASGIGAACARRFAQEGARIAGFDIQEPQAGSWDELKPVAPDLWFRTGDVRDEAAVADAVNAVAERFGGIDVVLNAAGVAGAGPVHLLETEEWDRVIGVNLKGTFLVCKYALQKMLPRESGNIINIASIEGIEGIEGGSAYNASKGAVVLLTRNLAIDYGRKGIRANCICPGFVDTPMTAAVFQEEAMSEIRERMVDPHQLGRMARPEEIAAAAAFLASEDASFVTGHALVVDGGFTAGRRFGIGEMLGLA